MMDERVLEEVKARFDILDVISDYVELRRAGQNYKGLCPFHSEKTPSFMVSPDKQRFHCFGCGAGGDIISFVMKYENLTFQESLKLLAGKAGINLKEYRSWSVGDSERGRLLEIHSIAADVFRRNLARSNTASSYVKKRGLTEETVGLFSLGYALRDWHYLSNYLKEKGFPMNAILQSGVASSGEKGIYDTFRDRIIFPICNVDGDIIAFGGRVMDDSLPKYLNSPESAIFKKGETLYGLNMAKEGIRKRGYAIIAEGYLDVIVSRQHGFDNTVAPLGTALTQAHLRKLKRFTKKAVLVFDGDDAGKSAARRSLPILLEQGFLPKILLLPEKDDPDSFLRKHGDAKFSELIAGAASPVEFILSFSAGDKTETVRDALGAIAECGDLIIREELLREISERTGIRESVLREELRRMEKRRKEKRGGSPALGRLHGNLCYDEELLLLSGVIAFPEKLASVLRVVSVEEFINPVVRSILNKLAAKGAGATLESIQSSLSDEEMTLSTRLAVAPGFDPDNVDRNIEDCIRRKAMKRLEARSREARATGDREALNALLLEKRRLIKEAG